MILDIAIGAVLGALLILYARWRGGNERVVFAVALIIAAVIYVAFGVAGGASANWIALELAGVLPFSVLAWLGQRVSPVWLALGWAMHVGWDVALHLGASAPGFVPSFYPAFCIGFDLLVALYIVTTIPSWRRAA